MALTFYAVLTYGGVHFLSDGDVERESREGNFFMQKTEQLHFSAPAAAANAITRGDSIRLKGSR